MKRSRLYMFILPLLVVSVGMLYACSSSDDDPGPVTPPEPVEDTLKVSPSSLSFEAADEKTETVEVEKTAATYDATCPEAWVVIVKANESFAVSVEEYTEAEAEEAGFESRTATITVKSGNADDVTVSVTQAAPGKTVYTLTTDPETVTLEPGKTGAVIYVTTNATNVMVSVPDEFKGWITEATYMSDVIALTFEPLYGTTNNTGYVWIKSDDLDEDHKLNITQKPTPLIDLSGSWNWTAERWNIKGWTPMEGTFTVEYNDEYGYYILSSLPEYMAMGVDNPVGNGGMALRVDGKNNVTSVYGDKLDMYGLLDLWVMQFSYSFRNGFCLIDKTSNARINGAGKRFEYGATYSIEVSEGGNKLTFPVSDIYDDEEHPLTFGFISRECDQTTHEESATLIADEGGLWRGFVLTRAE